jgi:hypothetical protein
VSVNKKFDKKNMKTFEERLLTVGLGGIFLLLGLLLTPFLIGIPILIFGFVIIFKHGCSRD